MTKDRFYLVAVHGGAGYHPPIQNGSSKDEGGTRGVKRALRSACATSVRLLQQSDDGESESSSAVDIIQEAITILEDAEPLNAGYGSNLTIEGTVECDASLMDGRTGAFGGVGSVNGLKNPIKVAHAILENSRKTDPIGRVPPLLLVSSGAQTFARAHELEMAEKDSMICPRSRAEWTRWKAALNSAAATGNQHPPITHESDEQDTLACQEGAMQDTVGAVVCAANGDFSTGVSSGGLLLKYPGRVGEAAIYGAGCWACHPAHGQYRGIAVSVSGTGEDIMQASLAKTVAEKLAASKSADTHSVLHHVLVEEFYELCCKNGKTKPSAGILVLLHEELSLGELTRKCRHSFTSPPDIRRTRRLGLFSFDAFARLILTAENSIAARLWCAFTTESMAVAYASSLDTNPRVLILRRPQHGRGGANGDTGQFYVTALPLTRL